MRLRYVGSEAETTTFGKTFYRFKWTSAAELNDVARATLAQNPQFEVEPVIEATAADGGIEAATGAAPQDPLAEDPVV